MARQRSLSGFLRSYGGAAVALLVGLYFCVHAYEGAYGIKHLRQLRSDEAVLQERAAAVAAERDRLEVRVRHLSARQLDRDLLDQEARDQLGLAHSADVIIFTP